MFQPQPAQRRHNRRLPSGTMVSYAEVKNYLSKREIPQLFESLMAGLMYHRPENHIGYLQTCLDEVKTNSDTKVHWSTFVNKKRKSKEILPPLTPPKKQESISSWSDNSRQSTPLPPISAKTRSRSDLRNTYILYHNPPPILAKPRVPVVSVLGGLGSRIDELCEKVVGRLSGVVHISTCSMLKTRMTIEGFYRVTSVPACAVVDSVLQAMSMVQSASALLVAGFPRSRGDIEEYRSRRVRMDGVVLVDFEEEALRRFLNSEVSSGAIRIGDIESELERYKQDIISVAEYYDEKDILTVVMGDQDTEEMIDDMVMAVDKIIETRKHIQDEDSSTFDIAIGHECRDSVPCKSLVPSPNGVERPSTVEIREATEEDIKSIEAASRNSKEDIEVDENGAQKEVGDTDVPGDISQQDASELSKDNRVGHKPSTVPILFAFENINTDCETLKDLVVNEIGMCYINFYELVRSDGDKDDRLDTNESLTLLQSVLQRDSVSYANGFFISGFPFDLLKESKFEEILKLGDISFVCKIREKSFETEVDESQKKEELLFESSMSEQVRIIFVTEKNIVEELKSALQEIVSRADLTGIINEEPSNVDNDTEEKSAHEADLEKTSASIDNEEKVQENIEEHDIKQDISEVNDNASKNEHENDTGEIDKSPEVELIEGNEEVINEKSMKDDEDLTSRDENEESTCQDVEDIITDDTLDEATKPRDSLPSEDVEEVEQKETEDTLSQVSEEGIVSIDVHKDKPVLARQQNLDVETTSASESTTQLVKDHVSGDEEKDNAEEAKTKLIRQETFVSTHETIPESDELQTDAESNKESSSNENQEAEVEAKTEDVDEQSENKQKDHTSENGNEKSLTSPHNDDPLFTEEKQADIVDNKNQEEHDANSIGDNEEDKSGTTLENAEGNCEVNENGDQDVSTGVGDSIDAETSPENIKNVNEKQDIISEEGEHISNEEEQESNPKNVNDTDTDVEAGIDSEQTDGVKTENAESDSNEENQEAVIEIKEVSDANILSEDKTSNEVDENLQDTEGTNEGETKKEMEISTDETSTDGDSKNSQIEASKHDGIVETENNEEEFINENESKVTENNEENEEDKVCEDKNETVEDVNGNEEESSKEVDVAPEISNLIDNDSDSNDEKSITIETKAEVHAPNSESPPLVQETNNTQELEAVQEAENDKETDTVAETQILQETDNPVTENAEETQNAEETDSLQETQSIHETQSVGEADSVEESCPLTENHPAVVENENYIIVDTDAIEDESDLLDCDVNSHTLEESTVNKEIVSETTEESQVTTVLRNESYSAKIQERNGSGILGDSRHEDHSGMDDPQERSSSSSRGEL